MTLRNKQPSGLEIAGIQATEPRPRKTILDFLDRHRRSLSAFLVFVVMMLIFMVFAPSVFLSTEIYEAVFTSLPIRIILVLPLVFVIVSGEIDLSFVSAMTVSLWAFAATAEAGWNPFLSLFLALIVGAAIGLANGLLVTRMGLSSMVATLGMSFLLRGLVLGFTEAIYIPLKFLQDTTFYNLFVGQIGSLPGQMIWALVCAIIAVALFNYHKFGSWISCVGDNEESSREMGIYVRRTKTMAFVYMGLGAAFAGVMSGLIYKTFWPRSGDPGELLLAILASAFIGGTPTWGGVGTVVGAIFGSFTIRFIETGVIAVGMTGFWTQLVNGVIILIALASHKLHDPRLRY